MEKKPCNHLQGFYIVLRALWVDYLPATKVTSKLNTSSIALSPIDSKNFLGTIFDVEICTVN
jgi:hypothetical protein